MSCSHRKTSAERKADRIAREKKLTSTRWSRARGKPKRVVSLKDAEKHMSASMKYMDDVRSSLGLI